MLERDNRDSNAPKTVARVSGSTGIVILPDSDTCRLAQDLGRELLPDGSELIVSRPHITLYHAKISDAPLVELRELLQKVSILCGAELQLSEICVFAGKFLFWNIEPNRAVVEAHRSALSMSRFLDRDAQTRAAEEQLSLSVSECANLEKYGHPLVAELYQPHITLGYRSAGLTANIVKTHRMRVESVELVKIGKYGVVEDVL